jgi:hypothetical protein
MKLHIPNYEFQRSFKPQTPKDGCARLGLWNLDLSWNLELGTWNF